MSFETFMRIQDRLKTGGYAPARPDAKEMFPLRGAVSCAHCGKPLTGSSSTSKTGAKHPYYMCFAVGCPRYRKSIHRDQIEGDFVALLSQLTPAPGLLHVARAMFADIWKQRTNQAAELVRSCDEHVKKIERQIGSLLDRIIDASSNTVATAYEKAHRAG